MISSRPRHLAAQHRFALALQPFRSPLVPEAVFAATAPATGHDDAIRAAAQRVFDKGWRK